MDPEDHWDAVHQAAAEQVDAFAQALRGNPALSATDLAWHADNAYVLVEFLANTYPKMPRDATERDVWIFLFDYLVTQAPYAGAAVALGPISVGLFFEFLARRERVREIDHIRAACQMVEYYRARWGRYEEIANAHANTPAAAESAREAMDAWYQELDLRMRERGLAPDRSLAGGAQTWASHMGPLEAAVFDAVCLLLAQRAREMAPRRPGPEELERELLRAQATFMTTRNEQLRATPLQAVLREREALATRGLVPE
jgi:hypothetical protein